MRIVYRMRGLLGDATEEFIESLDSTTGTTLSAYDVAYWTSGQSKHVPAYSSLCSASQL